MAYFYYRKNKKLSTLSSRHPKYIVLSVTCSECDIKRVLNHNLSFTDSHEFGLPSLILKMYKHGTLPRQLDR